MARMPDKNGNWECWSCKESKPIESFRLRTKGTPRNRCKKCEKKKQNEFRKSITEKTSHWSGDQTSRYEPNEEQLRAAIKEVQARWSPAERERRFVGLTTEEVDVTIHGRVQF